MEQRERSRRRYRSGCGCGCGGFLVVLTVGIVLSLVHLVVGIGISIGVPFTQANVTLAAALGRKESILEGLPPYGRGRLASNQDFINQTQTITIWPAEGAVLFVVGHQDGAPAFDLYLAAH